MPTRIFLIGQGVFPEGLAHLLTEEKDILLLGAAVDWAEARQKLAGSLPDVLIVDHTSQRLQGDELASLLPDGNRSLRVIYLSLAENRMIIHNQQLVRNVTVPDLLKAVHSPLSTDTRGEP